MPVFLFRPLVKVRPDSATLRDARLDSFRQIRRAAAAASHKGTTIVVGVSNPRSRSRLGAALVVLETSIYSPTVHFDNRKTKETSEESNFKGETVNRTRRILFSLIAYLIFRVILSTIFFREKQLFICSSCNSYYCF